MSDMARDTSLFEIDRELDLLLDEIQEESGSAGTIEVRPELLERFQQFCQAHAKKVDRIGHFLSHMEARAVYCRSQAARLAEHARSTENKVERTKSMVLYYLRSRGLRKIEGREFTLRLQKNSQDSVIILDEPKVPVALCELEAKIPGRLWEILLAGLTANTRDELRACVRQMRPNNEAIKCAVAAKQDVPGAEVHRGFHLRVV